MASRAVRSDPANTRKLAVQAARLAADTRCREVAVLSMVGLWPLADCFVLATGTSTRQMRTVCDQIEEMAAKAGVKAYSRSGYEGETWIVVDFVDFVVHLFSPDARAYYDLDNLWGDAQRVKWEE